VHQIPNPSEKLKIKFSEERNNETKSLLTKKHGVHFFNLCVSKQKKFTGQVYELLE